MKITRILFPTVLLLLLSAVTLSAQATAGMVKKTAKVTATAGRTETFKVLGNCVMCQRNIEKAALSVGVSQAAWNKETDLLTITFDPAKTSLEAVQKAVAQAGYDNVGYKAPTEAYGQLHSCCQYDRTGAPSSAKVCTEGEKSKN